MKWVLAAAVLSTTALATCEAGTDIAQHCQTACSNLISPKEDAEAIAEANNVSSMACRVAYSKSHAGGKLCKSRFLATALTACKLGCERQTSGNAVLNTREIGKERAMCKEYEGGIKGPFAKAACVEGFTSGTKYDIEGMRLRVHVDQTCSVAVPEAVPEAIPEAVEKRAPVVKAPEPVIEEPVAEEENLKKEEEEEQPPATEEPLIVDEIQFVQPTEETRKLRSSKNTV